MTTRRQPSARSAENPSAAWKPINSPDSGKHPMRKTITAVARDAAIWRDMIIPAEPCVVSPAFPKEPKPHDVVVGIRVVRPTQRSVWPNAMSHNGASLGTIEHRRAPATRKHPPNIATLRAPKRSVAMPAPGSNTSAANAPGNKTRPASKALCPPASMTVSAQTISAADAHAKMRNIARQLNAVHSAPPTTGPMNKT